MRYGVQVVVTQLVLALLFVACDSLVGPRRSPTGIFFTPPPYVGSGVPPPPPRGWEADVPDPERRAYLDGLFGTLPLHRVPRRRCEVEDAGPAACDWASGPFRVRWRLPTPAILASIEGATENHALPELSLAQGPWHVLDAWSADIVSSVHAYENVPHAGCRTLQVNNLSSGCHGGQAVYFLTHCPEASTVTHIGVELGDGVEDVEAVDLGRDGLAEFILTDLAFHDFDWGPDDTCGGSTRVHVRRLVTWSPRGWRVAPRTPSRDRFYAAQSRDALRRLRSADPLDDGRIAELGRQRGVTVGVYSRLRGRTPRQVERDVARALHDEIDPRLLVDAHGNPVPPDDEPWARTWKNWLKVDCVEDAPRHTARLVPKVDAFRARTVWVGRGVRAPR